MKKTIGLMVLAVGTMACQAVKSAELKTTTAADVRLVGDITAVQGETYATVNAKLETADSEVAIEFNQNEILSAASDIAKDAVSAIANLAYSWFELDRFYGNTVATATLAGNYYIHYSDANGDKTTVEIPNSYVAPIIAPTANATLSGATSTVTWDPQQMPATGTIRIAINYSNGSTMGYRRFDALANSGSYAMSLTNISGSGTVSLEHIETHTDLPGYAESNVDMRNVSAVDCEFSNTPTTTKSIELVTDDSLAAAQHECLHECAPNETAWVQRGEERANCCLGE